MRIKNSLCKSKRGSANGRDLTLNIQQVIRASGCKVFARHAADSKSDVFSQQLLLVKIALAQHLCASPFKKGDVSGMVDHTSRVCVFIVDTNRPSEQRITHCTSRNAI